MTNFIVLTLAHGVEKTKITLNVDKIVYYYQENDYVSNVRVADDKLLAVLETAAEIDQKIFLAGGNNG